MVHIKSSVCIITVRCSPIPPVAVNVKSCFVSVDLDETRKWTLSGSFVEVGCSVSERGTFASAVTPQGASYIYRGAKKVP